MEKVGHTTLMTMFSVKKKRNMITHVYLAHSVKKILNWKTDISHLPFPPKVTAYFSLVWNKGVDTHLRSTWASVHDTSNVQKTKT